VDPVSPEHLFDLTIYVRGGMALEALRQEVGAPTFMRILRDWVREHAYGNAGIKQFIELAEADSGQDLDHFFQVWLYKRGKPRDWGSSALGEDHVAVTRTHGPLSAKPSDRGAIGQLRLSPPAGWLAP